MAPIEEKERQLACLSFLYEAINETCRAGAAVAHSSDVAGQEENLSSTEILLCKLAHICDSRKGGDTITALVCLKGHEGPEYIICSNNRCDSELNDCRDFLWNLLSFVMINPDRVAPKPLVKQVLWKVLEFNINRVGHYLKALAETLAFCIEDCERLENGRRE
ncbi:hypothetical protein NLG97_g8415 [Lecanicillium saksenae]|uniref:Uncharacterized protein n=1 Tax=Lecanicillium saksenae TaxID=468837 RepID=A0ACC1QIZ2_9HYPO|nr:hypothetical protein NLG97_g8415 [Lecanicillium saksenae]